MTTDVHTEEEQASTISEAQRTELEFTKSGLSRQERGLYRDAARRFVKNKLAIIGVSFVSLLIVLAVFADDWFIALPLGREAKPLIAHTTYEKIFFGPVGAFPSKKYWMGTDLNGRDQWSRIVHGARVSLSIGFLAQFLAFFVGIPLGGIAGWKGGRVGFLIMRLVDIMSAIPPLLVAFLIMARLGAGFWNVMFAIGLSSWIRICRLTRAQFLALREKEFVEASLMIGADSWRIIRFHLLPNSLAPIIVSLTLGIPTAIFAEASLSFLGVGINPPTPSWGQMLGRDGLTNMTFYWHLAFFPALMIALTMLGFTLMGDGLRDALDPKMIHEQ